MTTTTSRRAILAGATMLPVASLPALAAPATTAAAPDPIFAAIAKHRHWHAEAATRLGRQFNFEESDGRPGPEVEADPRWEPLRDAANEAQDFQDSAARDLLRIEPTTVAGATALLNYYVEAEAAEKQIFPELLDNEGNWVDPATVTYDKSLPPFGRLLARNVACALGKMVQS